MSTQLLITLGGNAFFTVLMVLMGTFVLSRNPKNEVNFLFFMLCMTLAIFGVGYITAPLIADPELAYRIWFWNVLDVFITTSVVHFTLRVIEKHEKYWWYIQLTYLLAFIILAVALIFPSLFLPGVEPKLYFPTYLDGGPWYAVMLIFFLGAPVFPFIELVRTYFKSTGVARRRAEYFILMLVIGYGVGPIDFFLVFDVPVDPVYGMFLGAYLVPIAYGILSSQLMDIRVVIRQALIYSLAVAVFGGVFTSIILLHDILIETVPWVQFWTIPLAGSIVAVFIGRLVWLQTREADRLKYEFITIATHKLRTPLTRIRWVAAELLARTTDPKTQEDVSRITNAADQLIEITNVLVEAAHTEDTSHWFKKHEFNLADVSGTVLKRFTDLVQDKNLVVTTHVTPGVGKVYADERRLASVVEVLIENALMYTPKGGAVDIFVEAAPQHTIFRVKDTGIGVPAVDQHRIFSGFFRTESAKLADTEGIGLGLSVARAIIEHHGGVLGMTSEGPGKGSTFWFSLPSSAPAVTPTSPETPAATPS